MRRITARCEKLAANFPALVMPASNCSESNDYFATAA